MGEATDKQMERGEWGSNKGKGGAREREGGGENVTKNHTQSPHSKS